LSEQIVPVSGCLGRVLARPVIARLDLPSFEQAAMDGYAIRASDATRGAIIPVTGRSAAGSPPRILVSGSAHRILTGAPLPAGADTVVMQEHVEFSDGLMRLGTIPCNGANVRHRGEDVRIGTVLIDPGVRLDWRHLTVLAAQGVATVHVRRRPRVPLMSSRRELAMGVRPQLGQIHDSNLPMLTALLTARGADVCPAPVVADNPISMQDALESAAGRADLVLTTAGIFVGDDHVRSALHALGGDLAVLKVAMKPGQAAGSGAAAAGHLRRPARQPSGGTRGRGRLRAATTRADDRDPFVWSVPRTRGLPHAPQARSCRICSHPFASAGWVSVGRANRPRRFRARRTAAPRHCAGIPVSRPGCHRAW
jgi:molybdopterin molybdotransferase